MRVLERIEDEDKGRLASLQRADKHVVERRELAWFDDERDALVAIEAGQRRQRSPFDLDDGNAQARRVQDQLLQRTATLWHNQETKRRPLGREGFLDRAASGDQLLAGPEQIRRLECRHRALPAVRRAMPSDPGKWTVVAARAAGKPAIRRALVRRALVRRALVRRGPVWWTPVRWAPADRSRRSLTGGARVGPFTRRETWTGPTPPGPLLSEWPVART